MLGKFSSILINKNASVKEALEKLDKNAEKILFVVDKENKLIGSLTDGDVRRWILKDGDLCAKVSSVCYKGTYYVYTGYSLDDVKKEIFKRKIVYVPVLNKNKEIIEFLVWDKLFSGKIVRKTKDKLDVEVVIMAGGKGTRLDPFTRILPKPLIPIGEKSILEIIIEKFTEYQINEFYISVHHKAKIIKSYFEEIKHAYKVKYLHEDKPLGTVGAIKKLQGKLNKEIILTNCDVIIEIDYGDLIRHHKGHKNDITIVASIKTYNIPYGICEIGNDGNLINIREKPEYNFLVNTGMYVLNPETLRYIPRNKFFHMTQLIEKLKSTHKIGVYPISENSWMDLGEWAEYKKAVEKSIL